MKTKYVLMDRSCIALPVMVLDTREDAEQMKEALSGGAIVEVPHIEGKHAITMRGGGTIRTHLDRPENMMLTFKADRQ